MAGLRARRAPDLVTAMRSVSGALLRAYVAPEQRMMYISLNKNACTSLKWMMAHIAGEDLSTFQAGLMPFVGDIEAVHNRELWKVSPTLDQLPPKVRASIHPDNGWFVFAVIRDPRVRLFSAWQNKLLLEAPGCTRYRKEKWYPRHPADAQSVVADFARFVDMLERNPQHRLRSHDAHFRDQVDLLMLDAVSYTRIYDISEMRTLRADVQAHLESMGWSGELHLPKSNATPLRVNAEPFAGGVREQIERIYAADFAEFGERWDFSWVDKAPAWTQADLDEVEMQADFGRRIGDLRNAAVHYRNEASVHKARADELALRVGADGVLPPPAPPRVPARLGAQRRRIPRPVRVPLVRLRRVLTARR